MIFSTVSAFDLTAPVHGEQPCGSPLELVEERFAVPVAGVDDDVGRLDRVPQRPGQRFRALRNVGVADDDEARAHSYCCRVG